MGKPGRIEGIKVNSVHYSFALTLRGQEAERSSAKSVRGTGSVLTFDRTQRRSQLSFAQSGMECANWDVLRGEARGAPVTRAALLRGFAHMS